MAVSVPPAFGLAACCMWTDVVFEVVWFVSQKSLTM
jgi:hypothetical protein